MRFREITRDKKHKAHQRRNPRPARGAAPHRGVRGVVPPV